MTKPAPRLIEIFRAGTHVDASGREVNFTAADLKVIAEGYDPALSPAPVVIGHPKTDAPAYGWLGGLSVQGDVLFAEETEVDAAFNEARKAGRYKNRSASFYLPDSPSNPKPGQLYIKHVGWLGGAAPAVKGLKAVAFSESDEGVVSFAMSDRRWGFRTAADMFRRFRDWMIAEKGLETADQVLPSWQIESLDEAAQPDVEATVRSFTAPSDSLDSAAEFAERERALDEREERIQQIELQHAQAAQQARRDDVIAFVDGLVKDGCRVLPTQRATVVELILALPTATPLAFGEGDGHVEQPAPELMRSFLASLPKQLDFSERAGGADDETQALEFTAPRGAAVSADRSDLYSRAKAYQAEHPNTPWIDAVTAVGGK
ncbi:hypothetical protein [Stenotrophomonas sp. PS02298]|uniref:hypothetical protein n=1 Tax=Stenotrophomonas sp. PS02298 TaxID=2991424 RepID=UPI00249B3C38|nr:hypothetical protein [Stenotrophomonas sp. PS02298]